MKKKKIKLCDKCDKNSAGESDACPYEKEFCATIEELNNLEECNCCDKCRKECEDEI